VSDSEFEVGFEDEYDLNMRYYVILGNHDVYTNREMQAEVDYTKAASTVPHATGRWFLPSRYYSFCKTFKAKDGTTDVYVDFVVVNYQTNENLLLFFSFLTITPTHVDTDPLTGRAQLEI
jgi:hypothetical protein